jgi:hypothetical protein
LCFDLNGLAYLRTVNVIARYDPAQGWREVPWDYGEQRSNGGVGWAGKNSGNGCACSNFRFAHDYLARTFAPELDRYRVAVLDSSGNLIMRIGAYGNVDDGTPLVATGGPPTPCSMGGDEVALFHGA